MKFDMFSSPLGQPYVSEIEEVPLYHYLLGDSVLVLEVPGCPLRCPYCDRPLLARSQDWSPYDPARLAAAVEKLGSEPRFAGVVWSGGEPSLHWDNVVECSRKVHEAGKKVAVATNGGLTADLLHDSPGTVDALLVRFKGFADETYRMLGSSAGVLENSRALRRKCHRRRDSRRTHARYCTGHSSPGTGVLCHARVDRPGPSKGNSSPPQGHRPRAWFRNSPWTRHAFSRKPCRIWAKTARGLCLPEQLPWAFLQ